MDNRIFGGYHETMAGRKYKPLPVLGPLEEAVLEHLWRRGESDVIGAHAAISSRSGVSINTVGSALERLYRKGLASRRKLSHAYLYSVTVSRDDFLARRLVEGAGGLKSLARTGLLASFVDLVTEADHTALDELEQLIAKKRRENS
jgi:predicted transcriptional regulator